ncbi:hypothetical protein RFI_09083 [Reticulomyxa filosa]|uniref:Uncharacterized protein n=1 Tax=Reticulomyxa filosa TaxID=46433 RepID=X6NQ52_RETFI|nr:hypothetical protein RFI_09083 [Reticulomyxa filosa]|eukprot:ETO28048.1 hypothetical protein RFI_09083 [Reticulomyxa filosa]
MAEVEFFRKPSQMEIYEHISSEDSEKKKKRKYNYKKKKKSQKDDSTDEKQSEQKKKKSKSAKNNPSQSSAAATENQSSEKHNDELEQDLMDQKTDEHSVVPATEWSQSFNFNSDYLHLDAMETSKSGTVLEQYVLLTFQKPVFAPSNSLVIGSRLDKIDLQTDKCRLSFAGRLVSALPPENKVLLNQLSMEILSDYVRMQTPAGKRSGVPPSNINGLLSVLGMSDSKKNQKIPKVDEFVQPLKIYKPKQRKGGVIDKVVDNYTIVVKNLFGKESNVNPFLGLKIEIAETGDVGTITQSFGNSGAVYVRFQKSIADTIAQPKNNEENDSTKNSWKKLTVVLKSRKFFFQKYTGVVQ